VAKTARCRQTANSNKANRVLQLRQSRSRLVLQKPEALHFIADREEGMVSMLHSFCRYAYSL
jgi:hypothetical protein